MTDAEMSYLQKVSILTFKLLITRKTMLVYKKKKILICVHILGFRTFVPQRGRIFMLCLVTVESQTSLSCWTWSIVSPQLVSSMKQDSTRWSSSRQTGGNLSMDVILMIWCSSDFSHLQSPSLIQTQPLTNGCLVNNIVIKY